MAIVYEKLMTLDIPEAEQRFTENDTILYALGVGLGADPLDREQLDFVYEKNLKALPTMAVVLGNVNGWARDMDTGIDYLKVVHGEQRLTIHTPLPTSGTVTAKTRITEVVDKGEGRGALVFYERVIKDKATGETLATVGSTTFCRGDGGFGGPPRATPKPHEIPDRTADFVCDLPSIKQAALLYRLNGDMNVLHADPDVAAKAGFAAPILHGLASYGIAGHAIVKAVCGYDPSRIKSMDCRFTSPVYPGETFRTEIWLDGNIASFRMRSIERDVIALANGRAEITL